MGNTVPTASAPQATQDPRSLLQAELTKFIIQEQLGSSKFMKTYKCRVDGLPVVVKVYLKRDPEEDLRVHEERLMMIKRRLSPPEKFPSVLPFQKWVASQRAFVRGMGVPAFLVRQHFVSNLYDRLSTRPFLAPVEKKWITYQLLRALEQCHSVGVQHGDVKSENVMVTSWNWVVLTDFASFKPGVLPDDDPADFHYFFDSSGRKRCYIAPERLGADKGGPDLFEGLLDTDVPPPPPHTTHTNTTTGRHSPPSRTAGANTHTSPQTSTATTPAAAASTNGGGGGGATGAGASTGSRGHSTDRPIRESMDVFSLGCVIAEMFMDGEGPFDLPAMLAYHKCTSPLEQQQMLLTRLAKITDPVLQDVLMGMMSRDMRRRRSAKAIRAQLESGSIPWFPACFGSLYMLLATLQPAYVTPDDRIVALCERYGSLLKEVAQTEDKEGDAFFSDFARQQTAAAAAASKPVDDKPRGQDQVIPDAYEPPDKPLQALIEDTRRFLEQLKVSQQRLDTHDTTTTATTDASDGPSANTPTSGGHGNGADGGGEGDGGEGVYADVPAAPPPLPPMTSVGERAPTARPPPPQEVDATAKGAAAADGGGGALLIVTHLVCTNMRHLRTPQVKVVAVRLLHHLASFCDDDVRLQRIVPYVMTLLEDQHAYVKVTSLRVLTSVLRMVRSFPLADANIFPQYIFPELMRIASDPQEVVRIAFAECLASLAESSKRFLNISHATKPPQKAQGGPTAAEDPLKKKGAAGGGRGSTQALAKTYDEELNELHRVVQGWVQMIAQDTASGSTSASITSAVTPTHKHTSSTGSVAHTHSGVSSTHRQAHSLARRALLSDIMRLCMFFGQERTLDSLIPLLSTFFNDKGDWELRCALCDQIPAVCAFVGVWATAQSITPFLDTTLVDTEERVVAKVLTCLATLVHLGLLTRRDMLEKTEAAARLLLHPSAAIRHEALSFMGAVSTRLGTPDVHVFLVPLLRPYLRYDLAGGEVTSSSVERALKSPVSREGLRAAFARYAERRRRRGGPPVAPPSSLIPEPVAEPLNVDQSLVLVGAAGVEEGAVDAQIGRRSPTSIPKVASSSSIASVGESPLMVEEEKEKLKLMEPYVEAAARGSMAGVTKASVVGGGGVLGAGGGSRGARGTGATVPPLHHRSLSMSSSLAQSVAVPHQWFATLPEVQPPQPADLAPVRSSSTGASLDVKAVARLWGLAVRNAKGQQQPLEPMVAEVYDTEGLRVAKRQSSVVSATGADSDDAPIAFADGALTLLPSRIRALNVPPLPPDMGPLCQTNGQPYSYYLQPSMPEGSGNTSAASGGWRPKEGVLVATLAEHTKAVSRLAVAQDFNFFASASDDGTVKIWELRGMDQNVWPRSAMTYQKQQPGRILDVTICENSHSVASASSDGSVHVWRVDVAARDYTRSSSATSLPSAKLEGQRRTGVRVLGSSVVRTLDPAEGPVLAIAHFNTDSASLLVYGTQRGRVHCWDLRTDQEVWVLRVPAELGFLTAMTLGTDRQSWLCVGTNRGYILLWDLRFQLLVKVWRHSSRGPIHRLAASTRLPQESGDADSPKPLLFVAAGANEVAIWDLSVGGACKVCFRAVLKNTPQAESAASRCAVPVLEDVAVPAHPREPILQSLDAPSEALRELPLRTAGTEPSVRAIMGRINTKETSYLITGSSDHHIRFWDFLSPSKCYTVSGLQPAQPQPQYFCPPVDGSSKLFLCKDSPVPPVDVIPPSKLPVREQRGAVAPVRHHNDAVLDLKTVDLPMKMLLSCSRDETVKVWR